LAKPKHKYEKARPVISFKGTPYHKLLRVLGRLLQDVAEAISQKRPTFDAPSVQHAMARIHKHSETAGSLTYSQQDLVGFFTSVPQQRLINDVEHLLEI